MFQLWMQDLQLLVYERRVESEGCMSETIRTIGDTFIMVGKCFNRLSAKDIDEHHEELLDQLVASNVDGVA
jgi:hypothetical protein